MKIEKIANNKKRYLDLLLLADEQEDMIDRYLEKGDMFALFDDDLKTVCVVAAVDNETCELKNIATYEKYQGKGYARALIKFISDTYKKNIRLCLSVLERLRAYCLFMKAADLKDPILSRIFLQIIMTSQSLRTAYSLLT